MWEDPGWWLGAHARATPSVPCFVTREGHVTTYAEADLEVEGVVRGLADLGIGSGDRVGLLATDSVAAACLILAALRGGIVLVPLNYRLAAPELAAIVVGCRLGMVVTEPRYAALVPDGVPTTELGRLSAPPLAGREEVDQLGSHTQQQVRRDPELPALIVLTSGTTGAPKAVVQSRRMVAAEALKGIVELGVRPDDRLYSGSPLYHVSGLGFLMYAMRRGAALSVEPQFEAAAVDRLLREAEVSIAFLVPTMIAALLEIAGEGRGRFPQLRALMYGGASTPQPLLRKMIRVLECDLYNAFGAGTEVGGQTMLGPEDHRRALADRPDLLSSIGRPQIGVEVEVRDPDGSPLPDHEIGELWSRSRTHFSAYLDRPDLTAAAIHGDWFRSADLASRDAEGYFTLAGRADDLIIRGGENIHPAEIERALVEQDGIDDAAVLGVADERWGERVAAAVVLRAGAHRSPDEIRVRLRERIASFKVPDLVVTVAEIPRSTTGKVRRAPLLQLVMAGPTERVGNADESDQGDRDDEES